jgi:radical SAM superfamily enzyme YgiQ (UPF0313 family)
VITGVGLHNLTSLAEIFQDHGIPIPHAFSIQKNLPYPAFDMLSQIDYVCMITSIGCPYQCQYCASRFLNPSFLRREPDHVLDEIVYWHRKWNVQDIAFYDDALLVDSPNHIMIVLEAIIQGNRNLRFHTPNALHVKEISLEVATLLYRSGFRSIRLGLETSDIKAHDDLDKKVSAGDFERAVLHLKKAGFGQRDIGAYILMGLPGQSIGSVADTISFASKVGATPYLAEYSPLPHTPLWEKACDHSPYDLKSEPLFHNNTLLPCWDEGQKQRVPELKRMALEIRRKD